MTWSKTWSAEFVERACFSIVCTSADANNKYYTFYTTQLRHENHIRPWIMLLFKVCGCLTACVCTCLNCTCVCALACLTAFA